MNIQLSKLLLEQVYLPGKFPHYPGTLSEYSEQEIRSCEMEMEKRGFLKFWKQKAFYSISTNNTDHWTPYSQLRVSVDREACEKFLASIK